MSPGGACVSWRGGDWEGLEQLGLYSESIGGDMMESGLDGTEGGLVVRDASDSWSNRLGMGGARVGSGGRE